MIFCGSLKIKGLPFFGALRRLLERKAVSPPPLAADGSTETGLSTNPRRGCDKVFEENPKKPAKRVQTPLRALKTK